MELVDCRDTLGAGKKRGFRGTSSMAKNGPIGLPQICAQNPPLGTPASFVGNAPPVQVLVGHTTKQGSEWSTKDWSTAGKRFRTARSYIIGRNLRTVTSI